jgi:DNA-binding LacI/PurR family transcriptional regulator
MSVTLESKTAKRVSVDAVQPKYQILADLLRRQISQGELKPGDRMPSFSEIEATHRVTLTTVRRVYDLLEKDGLIARQQGRGTFVAEQKRVFTGNIGIIGTNDIRQRQVQYYNHIMRGIEEYLSQHDQHVLFLGENTNLDSDLTEKIDGFLMCDVEFHDEKVKQLATRFPCVSMFSKLETVSNVVADDYEGAKAAVRHMMGFGHRRIACLMEQQLFVSCQRYAGYRDALNEGGVAAQSEWARLTEIACASAPPSSYLEWGRAHMKQWLAEGWLELGCTAILVQNDTAAIGVMQILQEEGIKIPTQVSILGFDGTDVCDLVTPRITSMKVPLTEIGYTAAQVLHEQINKQLTQDQRTGRTIMLPMSLRPGGSVAAVPQS